MAGLREKQKEANRRKIIQSARKLIEQSGSTHFTMRQLAATAEVSTFTIHNLVGTKSNIIFYILMDVLGEIQIADPPKNPSDAQAVDYFLEFGDSPVDLYLEKEDFYRAVTGHLITDTEQSRRLEYQDMARRYWQMAVSYLKSFGVFTHQVSELNIVRAMQIGFTGTVEMWVHGELKSDQLRHQIRTIMALNLIACTKPECHERLYRVINHDQLP